MIIIPARLASTRFPKKILADIDGLPMVIRTAQQAARVDDVAVAVDDESVAELVKSYGFEAILTSPHHSSGTERVNEAATKLGLAPTDVIVNVQADEPFIEPEVIATVRDLALAHKEDGSVMLCSAYKSIPAPAQNDPNQVKVVLGGAGQALYFSRSPIPHHRDGTPKSLDLHLGIYGYTRRMLERFCALAPSPLEEIEKLEQLRALYHGYKVMMRRVESQSVGIDTPADLERALGR